MASAPARRCRGPQAIRRSQRTSPEPTWSSPQAGVLLPPEADPSLPEPRPGQDASLMLDRLVAAVGLGAVLESPAGRGWEDGMASAPLKAALLILRQRKEQALRTSRRAVPEALSPEAERLFAPEAAASPPAPDRAVAPAVEQLVVVVAFGPVPGNRADHSGEIGQRSSGRLRGAALVRLRQLWEQAFQ